jgi:hypothetical protein
MTTSSSTGCWAGCSIGRRKPRRWYAHFERAYSEATFSGSTRPERHVLYLIWKKPWMMVARDTYISPLAGLRTMPEGADRRYPAIDLGEKLLARIDRVFFSTEPFPFRERHVDDFGACFPAHAWKAALIDAQMVSWYGSQAIAGLEYLASPPAAEMGRPRRNGPVETPRVLC